METYGATTSTATATPRLGTPESELTQRVPPSNPFASPDGSMPASARVSATGSQLQAPQRYFHSRRIKKGSVERPWLDKKDPREKWVTIIPIIGIFIGLCISGFLIYNGLQTVQKHVYCSVYEDDFSRGWNSQVWTKEVEVGGFGYVLLYLLVTMSLTGTQQRTIRRDDQYG